MLFLFSGMVIPAKATHIVGGDLTYECLGNDRYRIQLIIFQDCINGQPNAIAEDIPAFIGIFDVGTNGRSFFLRDEIGTSATEVREEIVPPNFSNDCVNNPPLVCLKKVTFTKIYTLPSNSSGYKVVYTRCCRNATILNIRRPDRTGATYICNIPPASEAACNNSANFNAKRPPQIICINNPLVYDHSAFDADGDSLSYELCDTYGGGAPGDPKPPASPDLPPPISVSPGYQANFSFQNPMLGNPQVSIDPKTGILSGTPTIQGRFVVTVCCHEWRNGVMINTVRREFQFVVTNCSKKVVADIPQFSDEFNTYIVECESNTVNFVNRSSGGFAYSWDFGVPGATSNDFQPTYTYPDTGTYTVKLVVNEGSTCPDSIERLVKVYPTFDVDFQFNGLQCPNSTLDFLDMSSATYRPITSWDWSFGDGSTSSDQNPSKVFNSGGAYPVTLVAKTIKGCVDTAVNEVYIEPFNPFAGNDTVIVVGEKINFKAEGGIDYRWSPATNLNTTVGPNPIGTYPNVGTYEYEVEVRSEYGCEGKDDIRVQVVSGPRLFMPSGFTPNGDGLNDYLRPISAGYAKLNYFRVYNRWGEMVYEGDNLSRGWDGNYKGEKAEVGTYFWVMSVKDRFGEDEMIKGDVTLVR